MKKRISVLFLAILMLISGLSLLTACNEQQTVEESGPLGKYEPVLTVTYARPYTTFDENILASVGWTIDSNSWFDDIKKDLGVKIKLAWDVIGAGTYDTRLSNAIIEGNIPDILDVGTGETAYSHLKNLYEAKLSANLDNAYENYMSDSLKKIFDMAGEEVLYPATFNGSLYGFCQVTGGEGTSKCFYYIRKDWLDNLNAEVPTDYDSLISLLDDFTNKDPNYNTSEDTYGLALEAHTSSLADAFFNGLGAYPNNWIEKDGKLVWGSVQSEAKDALEKLAALYSSGFLKYTVYDGINATTEFLNGTAGVIIGQTNSALVVGEHKNKNNDFDFVAVPAFQADGTIATVISGVNSSRYYAASASMKYPQILIKLANYIVDRAEYAATDYDYFTKMFTSADSSKHFYNYAPVVQEDYPTRNYNISVKIAEAIQNGNDSNLTSSVEKAVYNSVKDYMDTGNSKNFGWFKLYGPNGVQSMQNNFFEADAFIPNKFIASPTATMSEKMAALKELELNAYTQIITGQQPVDYFDIFVEEWNNMGGAQITQEVNDWYATVKK